MDDLDKQSYADAAVYLGTGILQLIPAAGPFLSEILKILIPSQRLDRVVEFLRILSHKVDALRIELEMVKESNTILIEDGIILALRTNSQAQYHRLSKVIADGLTMEDAELAEQRFLLGILGELSDAEVIWLGNVIKRDVSDKHAYYEVHKKELDKLTLDVGATEQQKSKKHLVNGYHSHLERLGLISPVYQLAGKLKGQIGEGKYDDVRLRHKRHEATGLGELLYKRISL